MNPARRLEMVDREYPPLPIVGQCALLGPSQSSTTSIRSSKVKCATMSFFMPSSWSIYISPGVNVTSAPCEVPICPARH